MLAPVIQMVQTESRFEQELRRFESARQAERDATVAAEHQTGLARAARLEQGRALREIRDGRLYGLSYSFEHFCETRLGIGKAYAYRLIEYASIVDNLSPKTGFGDELSTDPPQEGALRPLARLAPDGQRAVWSALVEGSESITGARVKAAVRRYLGEEPEPGGDDEKNQSAVTQVLLNVRLDAIEESAETFSFGMPIDALEQFARLLMKHAKQIRKLQAEKQKQPEVL